MKFIDKTKLIVKAGKGGNGIVSFRREARVSHGGPDGGDGGRGGNVYFVGDTGNNTLLSLHLKRKITGNDGENGRNKNQIGANGKDVYIKVPMGTLVYKGENIIQDIVEERPYLIAKGGNVGKGNARFKSSKNTAPKISENGTKGETFELDLVLKVLADIGFVGKPSAGKSTLLSKVSNAKPKIAEYAFTTLNPQLGLVQTGDNSYVVADLPGLIQGAAEGKGLGIEFLKHIERCKLIAHVVDFGSDDKIPIEDFILINDELKKYSLQLEKRKNIVIANKSDLPGYKDRLSIFKKKFKDIPIVEVSSLTEKGIVELKRILYDTLQTADEITYDKRNNEVTISFEDDIVVEKLFEGMYEVSGKDVEKIYDRIPLNTYENLMRFNKRIKAIGVWRILIEKGVKQGDTVRLFSYEFVWEQ